MTPLPTHAEELHALQEHYEYEAKILKAEVERITWLLNEAKQFVPDAMLGEISSVLDVKPAAATMPSHVELVHVPSPDDIINSQKAKAFDAILVAVNDLEGNFPVNDETLEFVDVVSIIAKNWKGDNPDLVQKLSEYATRHQVKWAKPDAATEEKKP